MKAPVKIISGGQTGVDRAALDWALAHGLPHGGWCPKGRKTEAGLLPRRFHLRETRSPLPAVRTRWNVRDADGTVIFSTTRTLLGGTRLARDWARHLGRPFLHLTTQLPPRLAATRLDLFLHHHGIQALNIAGPRASQAPDLSVYVQTVMDLSQVLNCSGGTVGGI